jgi:hypothetical protein
MVTPVGIRVNQSSIALTTVHTYCTRSRHVVGNQTKEVVHHYRNRSVMTELDQGLSDLYQKLPEMCNDLPELVQHCRN